MVRTDTGQKKKISAITTGVVKQTSVLMMITSYWADSISRAVIPMVVSWLKFLRLALLIVSRQRTKPLRLI